MANKPENLDQFNQRITEEIFGPTKGIGLFDPVPNYILTAPNILDLKAVSTRVETAKPDEAELEEE